MTDLYRTFTLSPSMHAALVEELTMSHVDYASDPHMHERQDKVRRLLHIVRSAKRVPALPTKINAIDAPADRELDSIEIVDDYAHTFAWSLLNCICPEPDP